MNGFDRLKAALSSSGETDPQARGSRDDAWGTTLDVDRQTPDRGDIEDWTTEYQENVLIRKPTQTFTSDVLEPGYRAEVEADGEDESPPTVPNTYHDAEYHGLTLDEAIEKWLSEAGIVDGEFGHDLTDVLDKYLKDKVGRRGTAMVEVVYDDAEEQNHIKALRPFKVETVTAYTREGKGILLKPGDDPDDVSFETSSTGGVAVDGSRDTLPTTKADKTACYVQFDDVFGQDESDEVRLSQDDVVKDAYDADTGEVFGLPDTAAVYDRARSIRQQYSDLDQALKATAYSHWVAQVDTNDQDEAKELLSGFDPSNPEKVNVVNYAVEATQFEGDVPDIDSTLKQEIEYVLTAFPVPIYRIGFEGDINRDVTSEQGDDYTRELSEWRDGISASFKSVIQRKADEFLGGSAPETRVVIEPEASENPLHDEEFDASEFQSVMDGLSKAGVVLPAETVVETFLGLDADDALPSGGESPLDEGDPRVRESFEDATQPPPDGGESDE